MSATRTRPILFLLAAAGCGGSAPAATTPGASAGDGAPAPGALCIDPATANGTGIPLVREDQPGLVEDGDDKGVSRAVEPVWAVHAAVTAGDGVVIGVIARKQCGATPCDPHLVRVEGGKAVARVALPATERIQWTAEYPFAVDWLELGDRDGDGAIDVWLGYQVVSPPEPGVGLTTYRHVAVFSPSDLAVRWSFNHAVEPEALTLTCSTELSVVDADCDRDGDLLTVKTCRWRFCDDPPDPANPPPECKDGPSVDRVIHRRGPGGAFETPSKPR